MAKKPSYPEIPSLPQWETRSKVPLVDGRVPGTDNSLWLYRSVPMSSIVDAKSVEEAIGGGRGLHAAFEELAKLATPGMNRNTSKTTYREFHVLLLNVPTYFQAADSSPIKHYLNREFRDRLVTRRELLFGVKLRTHTVTANWRNAIDSFLYTLKYGGSLLSDYDYDTQEVGGALSRAGLTIPTRDTLRFADSWWNHGRAKGIPVLPHDDHMHYVTAMQAKREIENHLDVKSCSTWPEDGVFGEHAISFTALSDLDIGVANISDPIVRWAPHLLDQGARVVSVRGLVEPQKVTRAQLRSQKNRIQRDIEEFAEKNKIPREEQEHQEQMLAQLEGLYAREEAPATLVDCSVVVGFDGVVDDVRKITPPGLELNPLTNLQAAGWHETMLCSSVRANPLKQDLPATSIAYAGLPNLSTVGDRDGALLGFTERDGQPVYLSPSAASAGDSAPLLMVAGATGSGKSLLLQWLNHQWGLSKVPCAIIDPKQKSDFTPAVEASGGTVVSLDEFVTSDGPLDPIRFSPNRSIGVQIAADMISRVRPLSSHEMDAYETPIANAIRHGVSQGATATGEALLIAARDGLIERAIVDQIIGFAETYPMFRATFGLNPGESPISINEGITLFKVGDSQFDYPSASATDIRLENPSVRTSVNVMRMIVRAAVMNLSGRGGVLNIDEEWIYEKAAPDELEQLGRLARSQNVLVALYTQTPLGPLELGLKGYFSRGAIGHISDEDQARAGLELFGAVNPDILYRVKAREYEGGKHQFHSLKALWEQQDDGSRGRLIRPAVFYHADLQGKLAPVEVSIPESFFKLASTTPDDVRRREEARASRG